MGTNQAEISGSSPEMVPPTIPWPPAWLVPAAAPAKPEPTQIVGPAECLDALAEPRKVAEPEIGPTIAKPACRRCGSTRWRDVPIHGGQSTRRDCGGCGRFLRFAVWYGRPLEQEA